MRTLTVKALVEAAINVCLTGLLQLRFLLVVVLTPFIVLPLVVQEATRGWF